MNISQLKDYKARVTALRRYLWLRSKNFRIRKRRSTYSPTWFLGRSSKSRSYT